MIKTTYFIGNWGSVESDFFPYLKENQCIIYTRGLNSNKILDDINYVNPDLFILNVDQKEELKCVRLLSKIEATCKAPIIIYTNKVEKLEIERFFSFDIYGLYTNSISKEAFLINIELAIKRSNREKKNTTTISNKKNISVKELNKDVKSTESTCQKFLNFLDKLNLNESLEQEKSIIIGDIERELAKKQKESEEINSTLNLLLEEKNKELQKEINERKKAQELQKRFFNVIEQSSDHVMITNLQGVMEYVNPALCNYTLYDRKEIIGKRPSILKSSMYDEAYYKILWNTITEGRTFTDEFINKKKNGDLYTVSQVIMPLKNLEGKITHFASVSRDFTEKKRLEKKLIDVQENERSRISREMHDGVGQSVAAIKFSINHLFKKHALPEHELSEVTQQIDSLMNSIREISYDLMPSVLRDYGLVTAMSKMIHQIEEHTQIEIYFKYSNEKKRLPQDIELSLYRISQEALNNAIKYSGATKIRITLGCNKDKIFLNIKDNGVGFDSKNKVEVHGQGIRNMKHRAHLMNGVFQLHSNKNGTEIKIKVPFNNCLA